MTLLVQRQLQCGTRDFRVVPLILPCQLGTVVQVGPCYLLATCG